MKKTISIIAFIAVLTYGLSFLTETKKSEDIAFNFEQSDYMVMPLSNKILPGG